MFVEQQTVQDSTDALNSSFIGINIMVAVIPIKLEFSVFVGFIHKESVTMHGHTIVTNKDSTGLL